MSLTAQQLYWMAVGHRIAGVRCQFQRDVMRSPFFTIKKGATAVALDPQVAPGGRVYFRVQLDEPPEGALEFNGECHWIEGTEQFAEFKDDILFHTEEFTGRIPSPE